MADDSEEKQSVSQDVAGPKATIFEAFSKLKKWREEQVQQFRNMQLLDSQKFTKLSDESEKDFQKILESATKSPESLDVRKSPFLESCSVSSNSERDNFDFCNTLQESSISGHLQRCFDDSSQSNISVNENKSNYVAQKTSVYSGECSSSTMENNFSENKDPVIKDGVQNNSSAKPKRSFLKKGTGLLKYMPKSASNRPQARKKVFTTKLNNSPKRNSHHPQRHLKLKPAIRKTDVTSDHIKHIRFDIPGEANRVSHESQSEVDPQMFSRSVTNAESNKDKYRSNINPSTSDSTPGQYAYKDEKLENISNSGSENLNLSNENKELEEFEMLENCAQNSSFNSDSSIVQRVLHGEKIKKPMEACHENINGKENYKNHTPNPIFSPKIGLSKCLEEVRARKQILQKVISDINPRIQSLQKEISNCRQEDFDDSDISERCSTPIEDLSLEDRVLLTIPENDDSIVSLDQPASTSAENNELCTSDCQSCNVNDLLKDLYPNQNRIEEENSVCENTDLPQSNQVGNERSKIRQKVQELEKEIEIYQQHNSKLASICKERDEVLRKLQKEREDFNKHKEAEKKKLESEIQEERKQIKRQKETFMRYQKLRQDHPTRKEREELNALRQEVEKLQEELKRQRIKHTSESRRLKNQLDAAEKERDSFKLENIRLEEQVQDLLAALKSRIKKNPEMNSAQFEKLEAVNSAKESLKNKVAENNAQEQHLEIDLSKEFNQTTPKFSEKKTKTKVRFNLTNGCQDDNFNGVETHIENAQESLSKAEDILPEVSETTDCGEKKTIEKCNETPAVNLSTISVSIEAEFKEIDHGNKVERIYASGEREVIFNTGTRKIISADGQSTKFLFYNGDSKEIFSDKREIYRYVNGVTETHFPDGLEVTEFPNGQVQRHYPDGQKEVKFPDGTKHNIYADGSEEILSAEGNVVNLSADGTETIEFANGQKEIRTATYKRREFPDGSVKIVYNSGRQETRYSNGRIRIKDKDGKVTVDTKYLAASKDVAQD